jgi:hypothetical protein
MADAPQDVDKKEPAEQPKTSAQMTVQEKIAAARKYKDSGNEYYGKSEWRDALRQYHQVRSWFIRRLTWQRLLCS